MTAAAKPTPVPSTAMAQLPAELRTYDEYLQWLDHMLGAAATAAMSGVEPQDQPQPQSAQLAADQGAGTAPPLQALWPRAPGQRYLPFAGAPEFLVLPTGGCWVGAHPADPDAQPAEQSRTQMRQSRAIAISVAAVTFDEWDACLANNGTRHRPDDATWGRGTRPVMNVSWHDAEEYCGWLSRKTGLRCRLPSEAEWEYAFWASQPQEHRYPWGTDLGFRQLRHHAWFSENANLRTQAVGQLQPNVWGLVDMLGNVAEWVADAYHPDLSLVPAGGSALSANPRHASRVIKGGSWLDSARALRPSARDHFHPDHRNYRVGFRVVVELDPPTTQA